MLLRGCQLRPIRTKREEVLGEKETRSEGVGQEKRIRATIPLGATTRRMRQGTRNQLAVCQWCDHVTSTSPFLVGLHQSTRTSYLSLWIVQAVQWFRISRWTLSSCTPRASSSPNDFIVSISSSRGRHIFYLKTMKTPFSVQYFLAINGNVVEIVLTVCYLEEKSRGYATVGLYRDHCQFQSRYDSIVKWSNLLHHLPMFLI